MFGKGKIDIIISRTNFVPGDKISGNVVLTLKKPVKAREASISLIGEQTTTGGGIITGAGQQKNTQRIYEFKHILDGAKEYSNEAKYDFEIKLPADILSRQPQMPQVSGALGKGLKIAQAVTGMGVWSNWYLLAKLDVSGGMDTSKKVQITIG